MEWNSHITSNPLCVYTNRTIHNSRNMSIYIDPVWIGFIAAYTDAGWEEVTTVGVGLLMSIIRKEKEEDDR